MADQEDYKQEKSGPVDRTENDNDAREDSHTDSDSSPRRKKKEKRNVVARVEEENELKQLKTAYGLPDKSPGKSKMCSPEGTKMRSPQQAKSQYHEVNETVVDPGRGRAVINKPTAGTAKKEERSVDKSGSREQKRKTQVAKPCPTDPSSDDERDKKLKPSSEKGHRSKEDLKREVLRSKPAMKQPDSGGGEKRKQGIYDQLKVKHSEREKKRKPLIAKSVKVKSRQPSVKHHAERKEEQEANRNSFKGRWKKRLNNVMRVFDGFDLSYKFAQSKQRTAGKLKELTDSEDAMPGANASGGLGEEPLEDGLDQALLTDTSHRPDLVLVKNNNNEGSLHPGGIPFWKSAIPPKDMPPQQPISALLFAVADKKAFIKDFLAEPEDLDETADIAEMQARDARWCGLQQIQGNTIRSIIGTFDHTAFPKRTPDSTSREVPSRQVLIKEPTHAHSYARCHYEEKEREVIPFTKTNIGVCRKKKKPTYRLAGISSSSTSSSTSFSTFRDTPEGLTPPRKDDKKRQARTKRSTSFGVNTPTYDTSRKPHGTKRASLREKKSK